MEIEDKNVFVAGPIRRIGLAIARQFASLGANIVFNRRSEISQDLIDSFKGYHVKVIAISGDMSDFDNVKRMVDKAVDELGSMDILVSNTSITNDKLMLKMSETDFGPVLKVNLTDAFNMAQSVLKPMTRACRGAITNLSSIIGLTGNVGQANCAAPKAGLIGSTRSVTREVAARDVRVNAITPGFIEPDMTDAIPEKMQGAILAGAPVKRINKAEEMASVANFSAQQDYLAGQAIVIDGGMTMQ